MIQSGLIYFVLFYAFLVVAALTVIHKLFIDNNNATSTHHFLAMAGCIGQAILCQGMRLSNRLMTVQMLLFSGGFMVLSVICLFLMTFSRVNTSRIGNFLLSLLCAFTSLLLWNSRF